MNSSIKNTFQNDYSELYDVIYEKKDYEEECNRVKKFFKYNNEINNILDLGCGTCNHSIIMSKCGYNILAIDQSLKMLEIAKKKIEINKISNIKLLRKDIEKLDLENSFYDVILLLFNVAGYLKNFNNFLVNIKKYMKKGSLLIFDFWHESAVESKGPSNTFKSFNHDGLKFNKYSNGKINSKRKIINIEIKTTTEKDGQIISSSKECHSLKYFNLISLTNLLKLQGFEILVFEDFRKEGEKPSNDNWSAYCVSKFCK